ncbi:MAG: dual specificity protein phosphatase family protein [Alphaproteobacteria bacterium]
MIQVYNNLYVGDMHDCMSYRHDNIAIIHACKTCHRRVLGYQGSLCSDNPDYLVYKHGKNLYLNLVDMPCEFNPAYTNPIFDAAIKFIIAHIETMPVLIHCDCGVSRSPSIAMVYLAQIGAISSDDIYCASADFQKLYPKYNPGYGIRTYVMKNWNYLMRITS